MGTDLHDLLRSLRVWDVELPVFDPSDAPGEPLGLFTEWFADAVAAGQTEPHTMSLATADEDWQVALEVKNLTDRLYYSDVFDNRGSTSSIQGVPGMPRTWALSLRHNFD